MGLGGGRDVLQIVRDDMSTRSLQRMMGVVVGVQAQCEHTRTEMRKEGSVVGITGKRNSSAAGGLAARTAQTDRRCRQ